MAKIAWDEIGSRKFEAGIKHAVFYPYGTFKKTTNGSDETGYGVGVAWNGITKISESPDGADAQDLYADDMKYATLRGAENMKGSIEAYTYPDEFMECDGTVTLLAGVYMGQQKRKVFGMSYVTSAGDDTDPDFGKEKLHLVYGMTVSPSSRDYEAINDNPDAITFSWDYETTPLDVSAISSAYKPTAFITIDCSVVDSTKLNKLKEALYGTETSAPYLPLPAEVKTLLTSGT